MGIQVHYHRYPKCGDTHNTACSGYNNGDICEGPLGPRNPHHGEFICVHATDTVTREELFEFLRENLRQERGRGERPQAKAPRGRGKPAAKPGAKRQAAGRARKSKPRR